MSEQDKVDIFNIFHDGSFVDFSSSDMNIHFVVEIEYLAEIIHPNFKTFKGVFVNCQKVVFHVWGDKEVLISALDVLANMELEISKAKLEQDNIKISCWCHGEGYGGELFISCEEVLIFDEVEQLVTIKQLKDISHQYWSK